MHPVHEKYVGDASLTEHDFRSFSATTPKAMRGAVERTPIGFDFYDSCDQGRVADLVHEEISQAFLCDRQHRASKEFPGQWLMNVRELIL